MNNFPDMSAILEDQPATPSEQRLVDLMMHVAKKMATNKSMHKKSEEEIYKWVSDILNTNGYPGEFKEGGTHLLY